jgi:Protein of unknown function (DUF3788)
MNTKQKLQKSEPPANAFLGKKKAPTETEVAAALGAAKPMWDQIIGGLQSDQFRVRDREWKCPAPKYGWSLRLKRAGRNIVYLIPQEGRFSIAFTLGKRAVAGALTSDLPEELKQVIKDAPIYPEGTGVRFEVKSPEYLGAIMKLARFKLEN